MSGYLLSSDKIDSFHFKRRKTLSNWVRFTSGYGKLSTVHDGENFVPLNRAPKLKSAKYVTDRIDSNLWKQL